MINQETKNKMYADKQKPIPHYPLFRYWCPECNTAWESQLERTQYFVPCPDCMPQYLKSRAI